MNEVTYLIIGAFVGLIPALLITYIQNRLDTKAYLKEIMYEISKTGNITINLIEPTEDKVEKAKKLLSEQFIKINGYIRYLLFEIELDRHSLSSYAYYEAKYNEFSDLYNNCKGDTIDYIRGIVEVSEAYDYFSVQLLQSIVKNIDRSYIEKRKRNSEELNQYREEISRKLEELRIKKMQEQTNKDVSNEETNL